MRTPERSLITFFFSFPLSMFINRSVIMTDGSKLTTVNISSTHSLMRFLIVGSIVSSSNSTGLENAGSIKVLCEYFGDGAESFLVSEI